MTDDLRALEIDLGIAASSETAKAIERATSKGALNIKTDWKKAWSGHPHIPALPRAVTYDLTGGSTEASAEIGPDKARAQGPLGNIIEFGDGENAPIPGGLPALAAEEPRYVKAIADLAEEALRGRLG